MKREHEPRHEEETEQEHSPLPQEQTPQDREQKPPSSPSTPTSKRILAWIGVILMVLLVLAYTYSMATGKIFAW